MGIGPHATGVDPDALSHLLIIQFPKDMKQLQCERVEGALVAPSRDS